MSTKTNIINLVEILKNSQNADQKKLILSAVTEMARRQNEDDNKLIGNEPLNSNLIKKLIYNIKKYFKRKMVFDFN
jgi:low affinity Fe/Cu permease